MLLSARVEALDSLSNVAASGSGSDDFSDDDEQPAMRITAAKSAVSIGQSDRTAFFGRVCISAS
jgi:hypothetical protein